MTRILSAATLLAVLFAWAAPLPAQQAQPPQQQNLRHPVYRVSKLLEDAQKVAEHPLDPAISLAEHGLRRIQNDITDYTCTLVKRERINGKLLEPEYIFAKIRNRKVKDGHVTTPFSVYMYFLKPEKLKGQEVLYIEGQNNGKMLAHQGGTLGAVTPAVWIKPDGYFARRNNRYLVTDMGLEVLTVRLLDAARKDRKYQECEVQFFQGAKINGRVCTCIQVTHPHPRPYFTFHLGRIFIDDEMQIPIRYEAYLWPDKPGGQPLLDEEYTFLNVKMNIGLTDADFDSKNANYNF